MHTKTNSPRVSGWYEEFSERMTVIVENAVAVAGLVLLSAALFGVDLIEMSLR